MKQHNHAHRIIFILPPLPYSVQVTGPTFTGKASHGIGNHGGCFRSLSAIAGMGTIYQAEGDLQSVPNRYWQDTARPSQISLS